MTLGAPLAALEFQAPNVLWGLLLVVPLVLLHLYHRRKVIVPFLPLLVEAVGPRRPGGGWRKLRDLIPLVLRVVALLAVVFALAGLRPVRAGPPPEALVLVVDADLSTRATESDGRSRYAHALELARASVASATWAEVTVLEARDVPGVVVPPTDDCAQALVALDRLRRDVEAGRRQASPVRADLRAAVDAARVHAGRASPSRVRVLSARPLKEADEALEVWGTGSTDDDQGIVGLDLARDPVGVRVVARLVVANHARRARERTLSVRVGGTEIARRVLELAPGGDETVEIEVEPPREGAFFRAVLEGQDAFLGNDRVSAWLPAPLRPSLLLVHGGGGVRPFTAAVVRALGDALDVDASGSVAAVDFAQAGDRDIFLVDGVALPKGALRPGAWIFLAPLAGDLPFDVGEPIEEPLVWRSTPDHPLVRDLDLATAWIARGFPIRSPSLDVLAEADGHAVLGEGEAQGLRYIVLGLDPDRSDLPLRAALPLLLRNAIRRLAAVPRAPLEPFYRAGGPMRPRLPLPGGADATLRVGGQTRSARLSRDGSPFRVPVGARGEVEVTTKGPDGAVWTGHTAFVDFHPDLDVAPARPAHELPAPGRRTRDPDVRWRRALLAMACLLLLLDLLVLGRRRTRRAQELAPVVREV